MLYIYIYIYVLRNINKISQLSWTRGVLGRTEQSFKQTSVTC